jgi:hypothetical protein
MHGHEKSDRSVVPANPPNNAGVPAAENDGSHWPRRDGLKWLHFASVVVGVDVA